MEEKWITPAILVALVPSVITLIISLLNKKSKDKEQSVEALDKLVKSLQTEVGRLSIDNKEIREELGELRSSLKQKDELINDLEKMIKVLETENEELKEQNILLRGYNKQKDARIKELEG